MRITSSGLCVFAGFVLFACGGGSAKRGDADGGSGGGTATGEAGAGGGAGNQGGDASVGGSGGFAEGGSGLDPKGGEGGTVGAGGSGGNAGGMAGGMPPAGQLNEACEAMVKAANAFVASLGTDAAKRSAAIMSFADRRHFKYTPGTRPGLALAAMTTEQRGQALALLRASLSEEGFAKAEGVRSLEAVLRAQENNNQSRDPSAYFVAIYGTPAATNNWAWHWEGHHLSLHWTMHGCDALASTPAFFGASPARVLNQALGGPPAGTRVLARHEDLARELAVMLDADMQKRAMSIRSGGPLVDVADSPNRVMAKMPAGLAASAMSMEEANKLRELVTAYVGTMTPKVAEARMAKIQKEGWDKLTFLWMGSLTPGQAHYYRVQSSSFIIEYLNSQNDANHIHSAWRDFNGDFGDDVILRHVRTSPH